MSSNTKAKDKSQSSNVAVSNLENLTGFIGKSAKYAQDAILCILVELAIKFEFLELTAENWSDILDSENWQSVNKAFNSARMKALAPRLVTKAMRNKLALMDWPETDKKGRSYCVLGGVYRVTDVSTKKTGIAYSARYDNSYNSAFTVVRAWLAQDAEACLKAIMAEKPDVKAYNTFRTAYQAAKAEEKRRKLAEEQGKDSGSESDEVVMRDDASDELKTLWNKLDSVKRISDVADPIIAGTEAYTEMFTTLDSMIKMLTEIVEAQPDNEDEAEAENLTPAEEEAKALEVAEKAEQKKVANS